MDVSTENFAALCQTINVVENRSQGLYDICVAYNETNNLEDKQIENIVSVLVPFFFGIIGLAGFLGNILVVIVVASNHQMRSTTNLLIINLAAADLLFVIFCVPFTASDYVLPYWPFGEMWCKFVQYMIVVTCHASMYTLVLMSFDRYLAVVHPITSMSIRTEYNATCAIILLWIVIVTTAVPVALSHGLNEYSFRGEETSNCGFMTKDGWSLSAFQVSFFLSSYAVPFLLISFLYMGMLVRLWRSGPNGSKGSAESRRGKKRVTRLVLVVVMAFAICWLPIHIVLVLKALGYYQTTKTNIVIQIISHVLAYTNSCVNPLLYAFLSENFRKGFRKVVWCGNSPLIDQTHYQPPPTRTTRTNGMSNGELL